MYTHHVTSITEWFEPGKFETPLWPDKAMFYYNMLASKFRKIK